MAKKTKTRSRARASARPASIERFARPQQRKRRSSWRAGLASGLCPPPKLSLPEWADKHFYLSAESAADPGRWKTLPYQRGILDAIADPRVTYVSVQKSARVGFTKCLNVAIAYHIHHDPCPILVVQPTVEDAEGYSKEEIAPMLRDCKVLTSLVSGQSVKSSAQTILGKSFPGGILTMVGANSPRGFRRTSRRVVIFDEVDGYPPSAGAEGDQIKLGSRRADYYWNRKIIAGSTPLIAGSSRIEELFDAGDQRRYHVPCPHCTRMDFLRFSTRDDDATLEGGHVMDWDAADGSDAHFMCSGCGCAIEEKYKRTMLEAGEWRADSDFTNHASFFIWAAYSLSPNASWPQLVAEFLEAKAGGPEKLKTFVNTVLGQTWKERGEAPDWERLRQRAENYKIGTVPAGVAFLTAGVDVQKDRLVVEVVGWGAGKESWSIDAFEIHGDTSLDASVPTSPWRGLDELLARTFPGEDGAWSIATLAVDSGYNTQVVYTWAKRYPMSRVIAIKGVSTANMLLGAPSKVEIKLNGKRKPRGYKVWPVGVGIAKTELYGMLGLPIGEDGELPPGWCHFPSHEDEFFKQLTAEELVTVVNKRTRRTKMEWQVQPNRENHYLDARVYARAAAARVGFDALPSKAPAPLPAPAAPEPAAAASSPPTASADTPRSSFWDGRPRGGWLGGGRKR